MLLAMSRFILGFFVGVECLVTFLLSRARSATSMLDMGSGGDGVRRVIGAVTGEDLECSDEEAEEDEEIA